MVVLFTINVTDVLEDCSLSVGRGQAGRKNHDWGSWDDDVMGVEVGEPDHQLLVKFDRVVCYDHTLSHPLDPKNVA